MNGRTAGQVGRYTLRTRFAAEEGILRTTFPRLGVDAKVSGTVGPGCALPDGVAYDGCRLPVNASGTVTITAAGSDFDVSILLRDEDGWLVESGAGSLTAPVDRDREYRVVVHGAGKSGSYTLTTSFEPNEDETCRVSKVLAESGSEPGAITEASCRSEQSYFDRYAILPAAPGIVPVRVTSASFPAALAGNTGGRSALGPLQSLDHLLRGRGCGDAGARRNASCPPAHISYSVPIDLSVLSGLCHTCMAIPISPKNEIRETLSRYWQRLIDLSRRIHANPELGFEEEKASTWLAELLTTAGFNVEMGICGLPTAFRASAGHGPLRIAICAEYDSLPGIGHACGHNLIAAMSAGAAIAAARVADDTGCTITVLGTPAEEVGDGGGKILMMERGAFDGFHAAMMVHPAPFDAVAPRIIASSTFDVEYTGQAAHAAAFPELGINAADALTVAQTAVGLLRQHILPSDRIHGIVTHGGDAPNIVPARTRARYTIRAETEAQLQDLLPKVHRCFEAGAIATGCTHRVAGGSKPYAHMTHDAHLAELYRANAISLGRTFPESHPMLERFAASTDMGNVSQRIPSIHPLISINSLPAVNHQPEFTDHCVSAEAEDAALGGALSMAWTIVDAALGTELRQRLTARED